MNSLPAWKQKPVNTASISQMNVFNSGAKNNMQQPVINNHFLNVPNHYQPSDSTIVLNPDFNNNQQQKRISVGGGMMMGKK